MNNGGIQMHDESYTPEGAKGDNSFHRLEEQTQILPEDVRLQAENLTVYYGDVLAVKGVSMSIKTNKVTAIIGPSGCGKSTFIRCLNRMHEVTPGGRVEGRVLIDGHELNGPQVHPVFGRRPVG